jgi:hypothetical protein
MLELVKTALRITTTAYDSELNYLIDAAKLDLGIAGVVVPEELDAIVKKAIITYCKMSFGLPEDYDKLKRLRWIRNQLSHEVGYDSDICEDTDYDWLEAFSHRLYSANDPLATMNKAENAERQRRAEEQRRIQAQKRAEEERRQQAQTRQQKQTASSYTYTLAVSTI